MLGAIVLAWWTTPQGDRDGLWTLVFWYLTFFGVMCAGVARGASQLRDAREAPPGG